VPVYKYVAMNTQKQRVKGKFIAADEKELASLLAKNNLYLISSTVDKRGEGSSGSRIGAGKVGLSDLTPFCRQFSIMITAGIPTIDCLEILKKQKYSAYFKSILEMLYDDVKGGDLLAVSLDRHAKVFPNFFRSMIHVGEASGRMDVVLVALADYYESDAAIKRKAKSALTYPLFLLVMAVAIVILMLTFVVPTFRETMEKMGIEPEGYTKTIYDASAYIVANWKKLLIVVTSVALVLVIFFATKPGKYFFDVLKVYTPFLRSIHIDIVTARFSRGFSILLESGKDLSSSLDIVGLIIGNQYLQKRFAAAAEKVRQGTTLTDALKSFGIFPDMLIQMVSVGERTAALGEVLRRSCAYFDQKVETTLTSVTSKLQPIMLLLIGGIVGSLFLAVYSPMLTMMNVL